MSAGKIKSVHSKWMKANAPDDDEQDEGSDDEKEESDEEKEAGSDEDEEETDGEVEAPVVASKSSSSEAAAAAAVEAEDDEPLLPATAAKPSPASAKPAATKVKKASSKEISGEQSASKKSKDPGVQAEDAQSVRQSSSKKKKKHSRGGEEDADNAASAGAGPAKKKPKLKLSITGPYFAINADVIVCGLSLILMSVEVRIACLRLIFDRSLILMASSGLGQEEDKRDAHIDEVNEQMTKFNYGRHTIPVELICSPEEKYRARVAKQDNVDSLEHSLLTFGIVNEHVEVVLFVTGPKPLPPKAGFKVPQTAEEMKARGFEGYFTICGDHTQRAMNQLRRKFAGNPKWARLNVTVYVCARSTESFATLKSWGILDNVKGEKRVAVSFLDKITSLHEDFLSLAEFNDTAGHKERTAQLKAQRCEDFGLISSGQMI